MKRLVFILVVLLGCGFAGRGQGWFELGTGSHALNAYGNIMTLCTDSHNNLYAAGNFTDSPRLVGGREYVAKWDASTSGWSQLGTGSNKLNANWLIRTICADKYDNIYAAGEFADGASWPGGERYVAKWDGTTWSKLGTGVNDLHANGIFTTSCTDDSGHLYVAGNFFNSSGYKYVAKWDGSSWRELGHLNANAPILAICIDDSFNVYAAGSFKDGSGHVYVAKYKQLTDSWSELGNGFDSGSSAIYLTSICTDLSHNAYVAVVSDHASIEKTFGNIYRWDGISWSQFGDLNADDWIHQICMDDSSNLYAAGEFKNSGGHIYVAKCNTAVGVWNALGMGANPMDIQTCTSTTYSILSVCPDKSNHVYAAGSFTDSVSVIDDYAYVAAFGTPLAIEEIQYNDGNVRIYPNPTNGRVYIQSNFARATSYVIYDCVGRQMAFGLLEGGKAVTKTLTLDGWPDGVYLLRVGEYVIRTIKIVKQ